MSKPIGTWTLLFLCASCRFRQLDPQFSPMFLKDLSKLTVEPNRPIDAASELI